MPFLNTILSLYELGLDVLALYIGGLKTHFPAKPASIFLTSLLYALQGLLPSVSALLHAITLLACADKNIHLRLLLLASSIHFGQVDPFLLLWSLGRCCFCVLYFATLTAPHRKSLNMLGRLLPSPP